jgi:hypothetical protein
MPSDSAQRAAAVDRELLEIVETLVRLSVSAPGDKTKRELARLSAWMFALVRNHGVARSDCDFCNHDGVLPSDEQDVIDRLYADFNPEKL